MDLALKFLQRLIYHKKPNQPTNQPTNQTTMWDSLVQILFEEKVLRYFYNLRHNSLAFAEVVKVTN